MSAASVPARRSPAAALAEQPPHVRELVLALLDEMTSPLHPSEIEGALFEARFSRTERRRMVQVLKRLPIIAIGSG